MNQFTHDESPSDYDKDYPTRLLYLPRGIERLEKLGQSVFFKKDHVIIKPGEVPQSCFLLKKGRALAYEFTSKGEERVYYINEEGSLFLEANMLLAVAVPVYFKTTMPSELIEIRREELFYGLEADSQLMYDILESISYKFLASMDQVRQRGGYSATWQICNLLLTFAGQYGVPYDGKILIREKLSQQMISNLLGINRVTTVRIIKQLKDLNLIENINGYYCIRDMEQMETHLHFIDDGAGGK